MCYCCTKYIRRNRRNINIIQIIQSLDEEEMLIFIYENNEIYVFESCYEEKELLTRNEAIRIINFYCDIFHWKKLI